MFKKKAKKNKNKLEFQDDEEPSNVQTSENDQINNEVSQNQIHNNGNHENNFQEQQTKNQNSQNIIRKPKNKKKIMPNNSHLQEEIEMEQEEDTKHKFENQEQNIKAKEAIERKKQEQQEKFEKWQQLQEEINLDEQKQSSENSEIEVENEEQRENGINKINQNNLKHDQEDQQNNQIQENLQQEINYSQINSTKESQNKNQQNKKEILNKIQMELEEEFNSDDDMYQKLQAENSRKIREQKRQEQEFISVNKINNNMIDDLDQKRFAMVGELKNDFKQQQQIFDNQDDYSDEEFRDLEGQILQNAIKKGNYNQNFDRKGEKYKQLKDKHKLYTLENISIEDTIHLIETNLQNYKQIALKSQQKLLKNEDQNKSSTNMIQNWKEQFEEKEKQFFEIEEIYEYWSQFEDMLEEKQYEVENAIFQSKKLDSEFHNFKYQLYIQNFNENLEKYKGTPINIDEIINENSSLSHQMININKRINYRNYIENKKIKKFQQKQQSQQNSDNQNDYDDGLSSDSSGFDIDEEDFDTQNYLKNYENQNEQIDKKSNNIEIEKNEENEEKLQQDQNQDKKEISNRQRHFGDLKVAYFTAALEIFQNVSDEYIDFEQILEMAKKLSTIKKQTKNISTDNNEQNQDALEDYQLIYWEAIDAICGGDIIGYDPLGYAAHELQYYDIQDFKQISVIEQLIAILLLVSQQYVFLNEDNQSNIQNIDNNQKVIVPKCSKGTIDFNNLHQTTNGEINQTQTQLSLCHNEKYFQISFINEDFYIHSTQFKCNDPLFTQDVNEFFLGDPENQAEKYYKEFEFNPYGTMFLNQIINDGTKFTGTDIPCDTSGVIINTQIQEQNNQWLLQVSVPFSLILDENYKKRETLSVKGNFYRIDLTSGEKCSGTQNCYYYAYNPTLVSPPNFHKPQYFVEFIME
ncbi:hypothetical protein PPERSA_09150 [Pseudocohnilembus persalinus]|uniref:Uncharacterized protein n=1 Tax=Pseudocohnilembus persalinus TaxID=266149 RepID=A0A0V0QWK8_PSEPJ|nr:hypothetical protein PPERSA_09150 [Pseudocohnilembus persalinus]|eukprot:KRX06748.1 hypothetical protein PPERSA_09150 [Pseudocohnilembus persalinus]